MHGFPPLARLCIGSWVIGGFLEYFPLIIPEETEKTVDLRKSKIEVFIDRLVPKDSYLPPVRNIVIGSESCWVCTSDSWICIPLCNSIIVYYKSSKISEMEREGDGWIAVVAAAIH